MAIGNFSGNLADAKPIETSHNMFTVHQQSGAARTGTLHLPHGDVPTPVFMPVGTAATIKSLDSRDINELGFKLILANTYHLALRPGASTVSQLGGLRTMMNYGGNILTDSGGYQVFSLAQRRKILPNGVEFQSHIDGSRVLFTPESVQQIQEKLGSTIVMPLDICPPGECDQKTMLEACEISRRWYLQAQKYNPKGILFGIVQGGTNSNQRRAEIEWMQEQNPAGLALGGFSVGEPREKFWQTLSEISADLPTDRPVYAMGIGDPRDLVYCSTQGVDMYDCVLPTRNARNGRWYIRGGYYNIKRADLAGIDASPDPSCGCSTCTQYSVGYLRHLYIAKELSYYRLATIHNLWYIKQLMAWIQVQIAQDRMQAANERFQANWVGNFEPEQLHSYLQQS